MRLPHNRYSKEAFCGGSLIARDLVLTAAHCLYNDAKKSYLSASKITIVLGSIDMNKEDNNTLVIRAHKIVGHLKYDDDTHANDIALIFLSKKVPMNHPTARPISLTKSEVKEGETCVISGWGRTVYKGETSSVLRSGNVTVNSKNECNDKKRYAGAVLDGMFCAGNFTGKDLVDTCQGDSGGPLVCDGVLVGITSSGKGCGIEKYPGVYTDIHHYRKWIKEKSTANSTGLLGSLMSSVTGFIQKSHETVRNWVLKLTSVGK